MAWRDYVPSSGAGRRGRVCDHRGSGVLVPDHGPCDALQQAGGTATVSLFFFFFFFIPVRMCAPWRSGREPPRLMRSRQTVSFESC